MSEELLEEKIPAEPLKKNKLFGKTALKDHIIFQNKFRVDIKKGDDLSDVPDKYYQNLVTERVIIS